jgi:hypothetical protein
VRYRYSPHRFEAESHLAPLNSTAGVVIQAKIRLGSG